MKQNIIIRKRKSVKKGVTYEYRFETASIGGQRKWISKGGFEDENTARIEGIKALNQYNTCGKVEEPTKMSVADFLEHWLVNDCGGFRPGKGRADGPDFSAASAGEGFGAHRRPAVLWL